MPQMLPKTLRQTRAAAQFMLENQISGKHEQRLIGMGSPNDQA
jgi:hypothetical protein